MSGRPRVVAVGGFDPSGRAGVLADVATISSLGAQGLAVVTCLTAQGRRPICRPVELDLLAAQLDAVADSGALQAIKVGVVPTKAALSLIGDFVRRLRLPAVVDPVTVSSAGLRLSRLRPSDFGALPRKFVVLTPNHEELAPLQSLQGFRAIVAKSVTPGSDAIFLAGKSPIWLTGKPLLRSKLHRGTGCRFASALAVELAKGHTVVHAAKGAKRVVRKFLAAPILQQVQGA